MNERKRLVITLPIAQNHRILYPEHLVLSFGAAGNLDVGALCYLQREPGVVGKVAGTRRVEIGSISDARRKLVRKIATQVSAEFELGSNRPATQLGKYRYLMMFVDWCDGGGRSDVLASEATTRAHYRSYGEHLHELVRRGELKPNTAVLYQKQIAPLIEDLLGIESIKSGVRLIANDRQQVESTSPPDESSQARVLALCSTLFWALSKLSVGGANYPFKMDMPLYLGWENPSLWIFPTNRWCMPPWQWESRDEMAHPHWAYDYKNGRLASLEEAVQRFPSLSVARLAIRAAAQNISKANTSKQHGRRRDAAIFAHNVFIILFCANTGMNWADIRGLPWSDDFKSNPGRQGFRSIKYRAQNKLVSFEIQSTFHQVFLRYIELRRYLLNGRNHPYLFVGFGSNQTKESEPRMIGRNLQAKAYDGLKTIDPLIPKILNREWRAAKSDFGLRNADPATTAGMLQNTEATVLRAYAAGSETTMADEMGDFFERVANRLKRARSKRETAIAMGSCSDFKKPVAISASVATQPDCGSQEGCLFCKKLRIHSDEIDVRKLISCRLLLTAMSSLADDIEHFNKLIVPSIEIINKYLSMISSSAQGRSLVERVRVEVEENGDLDAFWESRMSMLFELDLIS